MLSIYLFDNDNVRMQHYREVILKFLLFKNWDMKIVCATDMQQDIFSSMSVQNDIGLYFLNVDLQNGIDGFELSEKIRQLDPRGFIVFLVGDREIHSAPYEKGLEALGYVLKNKPQNAENTIEVYLEKAYSRYTMFVGSKCHYLIVESAKIIHFIKPEDIIVICTSTVPHQVEIVKTNEILSVYSTLKEIELKLDSCFYRIHKSYIINSIHLARIDKDSEKLEMDNGMVIPISSSILNRFFKKFNETEGFCIPF